MDNYNEYMKIYHRKLRTKIKICKNCKKEYLFSSGEHNGSGSKFCSKKCSKIDAKKRTINFMHNHPEISKRDRDNRRLQVLTHYSNGIPKCACCGETIIVFLCVDHIHGGGNKHRKEMCGYRNSICYWLKLHNFPEGYQVLCFNCNKAKGRSKARFCPVHHPELYKKS